MLTVFRLFRFSTLEGLRYYHASSGRRRRVGRRPKSLRRRSHTSRRWEIPKDCWQNTFLFGGYWTFYVYNSPFPFD